MTRTIHIPRTMGARANGAFTYSRPQRQDPPFHLLHLDRLQPFLRLR